MVKNKSLTRKIISEAKNSEFETFQNIKAAKKSPNSYLIMEGDYGGQIYLSIPVKKININNEETIEKLLLKIDEQLWNNPDGVSFSYEKYYENDTIPGGMNGGCAINRLWIHEDVEKKGLKQIILHTLKIIE